MVMRVAVLVNEVPPYRVALLEALEREVDQLRIFVSTPREPDRPWETDWGSLDVVVQKTLTVTTRRAHPQGYRQTMYVHVPYDTLAQLRRYKPDVIITGEMGARSIQAAIYRRLAPSARLVVWCTLSETSEAGWSWARTKVRQLLVAVSDGFVAGGQSGRRYLRRIGAPDAKIFIANQTVDISLFSSCPLIRPESAARKLLYSGRFIGKKGLQAFQADAARWAIENPHKTISIRWVGDGELREALESFSGPSNFQQEFTGSVDYSDLPRHYAECGILVLPTLDDEWGLVVNEAFASGLPVLGTIYSQAVEELVEEGRTGWIYDPKQPGSAHHALDRLFATSDDDLYAMRERARARIGRLNPRTTAAIFRKVIGNVHKAREGRLLNRTAP